MSRVQEYLKNKNIQKMGYPKLWVVKSTREGVEKPVERQVEEIRENIGWEQIDGGEKNIIDKYILDKTNYPYEVYVVQGKISIDEGHGSGIGDLWSWTYFTCFSKEEADAYYLKEWKRVNEKYLRPKMSLEMRISVDSSQKQRYTEEQIQIEIANDNIKIERKLVIRKTDGAVLGELLINI